MAATDMHRLVETIHQSGPVDTKAPYSTETLNGKTIVITGGASGFGAAFARHWASHGATIIVGDLNDREGNLLVDELQALPGSSGHHFFQHCDVTSWKSQVELFQAAIRASPTGRIDAVVPNAGIVETDGAITGKGLENPVDLDTDSNPFPAPPRLDTLEVNLTGVIYTVHLALYWLCQPPKRSQASSSADSRHASTYSESVTKSASVAGPDTDDASTPGNNPASQQRDRHILLIGSLASICPLPGQPLYAAAKHAVMGLFRSLRGTAWRHGVRVNILCPYFVDTPLLPTSGMLLLAGGTPARLEDVVDAGTRLVADESICGRALVVGPELPVYSAPLGRGVSGGDDDDDNDDDSSRAPLLEMTEPAAGAAASPGTDYGATTGRQQAVWECYAHDYDSVDLFVWRYVQLLNRAKKARGFFGVVKDIIRAIFFRRKRSTTTAPNSM